MPTVARTIAFAPIAALVGLLALPAPAALAAPDTPAADEVVEVRLLAKARPQTVRPRLGDLAVLRGGLPEQRATLAELPILGRPWRGASTRVTREQVEDRVVAAGLSGGVAVGGALTCTLSSDRWREVGAEELQVRITDALRARGDLASDFDLIWRRPPSPVRVPPGWGALTVEVKATPARQGASPGGPRELTVTALVQGERLSTQRVYAVAERMGEALVVTRAVARGTLLTASMVERRRMPIRRWPSDALQDSGEVTDRVARRGLRPGDPLTERNAARDPIVRRGAAVTLRVQRGALLITTFGIARQSGALGDAVAASNARSGSLVHGVVAAPGVIDVTPGARHEAAPAPRGPARRTKP